LRSDLNALITIPIVIRTDTDKTHGHQKLFLPRTDAITSVDNAVYFIQDTLRTFAKESVPFEDICFLLHRLIPAHSGAYAFARPARHNVRIDTLWGSPDGLNYYAHDSFQVDIERAKIVRRKIRCKTHYIDLDSEGRWIEMASGHPWDWTSSATDDDLVAMAVAARKIATRMDQPVAVMFFVGVDSRTGLPSCLPWFIHPNVVPDVDHERAGIRLSGRRISVVTEADLEAIEHSLSAYQKGCNIRLRPVPALLRSTPFLRRVAEVANRTQSAVELEGSILSHAYYVLKRDGVRLRTVEPLNEPIERRRFGKLVRGLIPLRILSHGEEAKTIRVSKFELISLLKAKAIEEGHELFWETDPDAMLDEMADLLEVIESTCRIMDRSPEDLRRLAERKRVERGGFDEGIVLVETRAVPLIGHDEAAFSMFQEPAGGGRRHRQFHCDWETANC
jgi:predicted house-cleaning noncanonical NTP pyrophosphatase (MazG superfamily)